MTTRNVILETGIRDQNFDSVNCGTNYGTKASGSRAHERGPGTGTGPEVATLISCLSLYLASRARGALPRSFL